MKTKESVLLLLVLAAGCSPKRATKAPAGWYSETRELYYRIPVTVKFTPADEELADRVWRKLVRVDDVFNIYRPDSEVSSVNDAAATAGLEISSELDRALTLSRQVSEDTHGAFDVTVGPLVKLWKDAAKAGRSPSADDVAAARRRVGMVRFRHEGRTLSKDWGDISLDFGGIIKGIAVDDVIAMLKEAGCTAALVQIGGETGAYGVSLRGKRHVIGVQDPTDLSKIWTAVQDQGAGPHGLKVRPAGAGISAATSGNYQQPVVIGGRVFYHIIDPRTGYPVDTHTLSVTVVFPETGRNGLADGLSTAGAVLGPEKAIPVIRKLGGEALFLIRTDGGGIREVKSGGWDALVCGQGGESVVVPRPVH